MKFGAHQSFHLRDSWLYKGLTGLRTNNELFKDERASDILGVGTNMVDSMRYWLEACQVVEKKDSDYRIKKIALTILKYDPYFELDGTLWLLHYLLASNEESATTWFWFFNKFGASEFDLESLQIYLQNYVSKNSDRQYRPQTLNGDIACLLKMYRRDVESTANPEAENPSPFLKFNLLEGRGNKIEKRKIHLDEVPEQVLVFLLSLYWREVLRAPKSVSLDNLVQGEKSPGLILGFSMEEMATFVEMISQKYPKKYFEYSRTGGYFIINFLSGSENAFEDYYKKHSLK